MSDAFYTRPIFHVRDIVASIAYYRDALGFRKDWDSGDDPPVIAQVSRDGLDIILNCQSVIPRAAVPSVLSMSLHAPETLETLHKELRDRGAKIVKAPFEVVWQPGTYQFDVEDLEGNVLIFWGEKPA